MNAGPAGSNAPLEAKIILTGLGGQGVVFATRLLAHAAMAMGHQVIASESHGMSQRGGSVVSHLKIGGTEAPLIRRGFADVLFGLEAQEAVRNLLFLRRGGIVFANAESGLGREIERALAELDIEVYCLPASRIAKDLGAAPVANVVLAGFAAVHPRFPLSLESFQSALENKVARGKEANLRALAAGANEGQKALREPEASGRAAGKGS